MIDVVPTILELAGVKRLPADAPKAPGRSLLPAFSGDASLKREYLWWLHGGHRAIRVYGHRLDAGRQQSCDGVPVVPRRDIEPLPFVQAQGKIEVHSGYIGKGPQQ